MTPSSPLSTASLPLRLAFTWLGLGLTLLMVISSTLVKAAIQTDFSEFIHHPGPRGWEVFSLQFFLYLAMGTGALYLQAAWFRWLTLVLLTLAGLYMLAHQISHMAEGWRYGLTGAIDLAHHLLSALGAWQAWRWTRQASPQGSAALTQPEAA
ncbi:hypothetical protein ACS5PK_09805 [Roseateles sp. DB2]|uniref:hypothetical protein n=1 Tax=Roseateles sp. DB2 TaxID=3453717 RepID=UPI003EEA4DA9